MSKLNEAQKNYIEAVGLDAADDEELSNLGDLNTDNGDTAPDNDENWDGVFRDIDRCGVDTGYPPGSEGAIKWERNHPGRKVVDWLGRGEDDPAYAPTDSAGGAAMDYDEDVYPEEYRNAIDAINRKCRGLGVNGDAFTYDGGLNIARLSDADIEKIPDSLLSEVNGLMFKYRV